MNLELKCFNTSRGEMFQYPPIVYYRRTLYNSSINIGSISFFLSTDTRQSHHLLGCHVTSMNSSFNSFLRALRFSDLICQVKGLT